MNEIQSIITERVDDIPLLLAQMQRRHWWRIRLGMGITIFGRRELDDCGRISSLLCQFVSQEDTACHYIPKPPVRSLKKPSG